MPTAQTDHISPARYCLLFVLFFAICWSLGYASLNRFGWQNPPNGIPDIKTYAQVVVSGPDANDYMTFRVLVPYLAKPIYHVVHGHIGSWDPVMLSLLVVNSAFTSATVLLLMSVAVGFVNDYAVSLGAAFLYLLNFAIANLRLVGLIDSAEAFFLMLTIWALATKRDGLLVLCGILGVLAKESFLPFLVVLTLAWWWSGEKPRSRTRLAWIVASWLLGTLALVLLHHAITHTWQSPLQFGESLHQRTPILCSLWLAIKAREFWYVFVWLLPLSLPRLKLFPREWRIATLATSVLVVFLYLYTGADASVVARELFTVAGALLSASAAHFLFVRSNASD